MDNKKSNLKTGEEDKRLHLKFIEDAIDRMASNSFLIKGWSITALGGLIAVYIGNQNKSWSYQLLVLIFSLVLMFWGHDAYYLLLERQYRNLYEKVVGTDVGQIDYSMKPLDNGEKVWCVALAPILKFSYGIISVVLLVLLYMKK
ncbi:MULTISPECIES: hypothetical protein [Lactobacillaceae]|uniref:Uncharacterized protein n=2 Tax=Levilactobacillus brevis TaxID=1580 RepID=C0SQN4_LEVBR|nr:MULTISPECIES: hypothetical protein [Lactobacillaceae]ARO02249.1 hypothetical protein BIZ31_14980 [Lactiplantibacillus plantarum]ARO05177.1 hypothetical protein BIZ32_14920 [Lactiplantibacillus plantarum]QCZ54436.1 hypothetical protein UCCLBBS449_pA0030 [Levilactobacillus brevis]BAH56416.1 hypothetical protein [Levilactobacillus brevis]